MCCWLRRVQNNMQHMQFTRRKEKLVESRVGAVRKRSVEPPPPPPGGPGCPPHQEICCFFWGGGGHSGYWETPADGPNPPSSGNGSSGKTATSSMGPRLEAHLRCTSLVFFFFGLPLPRGSGGLLPRSNGLVSSCVSARSLPIASPRPTPLALRSATAVLWRPGSPWHGALGYPWWTAPASLCTCRCHDAQRPQRRNSWGGRVPVPHRHQRNEERLGELTRTVRVPGAGRTDMATQPFAVVGPPRGGRWLHNPCQPNWGGVT